MAGLLTITVESFLISLVSFMIFLAIIAVIFSTDKLYCKVSPNFVLCICVIAVLRILYPFDIIYGHDFRYRGALRKIFISLNRVWDRDVYVLKNVSVVNIIFIVWIIGAVIRIIKLILDYNKSMIFIRKFSEDITDSTLLTGEIPDEERKYIGKRRIKILKTRNIYSPLCCGLISPMILIPDRNKMADKHIKVIVDHELAHIRSGDLFTKLFMAVARLIYWWFPPFGVLCRYCSLAIEMNTDKRASQSDDIRYVEAIYAIMEAMEADKGKNEDLARIHPFSLFSQESEMKKRFTRLMKKQSNSPLLTCMFGFLVSITLAVSLLLCVHASYTDEEQAEINADSGFFAPNEKTTKIIKLDSGGYEVQVTLEDGYVFKDYQENLYGYSHDIKIYNEQGEIIKWPFFGRLK